MWAKTLARSCHQQRQLEAVERRETPAAGALDHLVERRAIGKVVLVIDAEVDA